MGNGIDIEALALEISESGRDVPVTREQWDALGSRETSVNLRLVIRPDGAIKVGDGWAVPAWRIRK